MQNFIKSPDGQSIRIMKRSNTRKSQDNHKSWYQCIETTQIMNQQQINKDMALIRRQLKKIQERKNKIYSLIADLRVMCKLQEKISQKITQPVVPETKDVKSQFYHQDQSAQQQRQTQ